MVSLVSTRTLQAFFAKVLSRQLYWWLGLCLLQVQDSTFPIFEFHEVPITPFLQSVKVLLTKNIKYKQILQSSASLLILHSAP